MPDLSPRVIIAANSLWNIVNYRRGLLGALKTAGYRPIVVAPPDPESMGRLKALGVPHIALDIRRSAMSPVADAQLFLAYRRIVKKLRPAAFLGFTIKPNIYGAVAAQLASVPMIANISGLGTSFAGRGLLRRLVALMYRWSMRKTATVFFQNPDDECEFLREGLVRRDQARLLPGSGVDLAHFAPSPLPQGGPVFLLIARLLADKGVREYVEAAQSLRPRFPDAKFQLLGPIDDENPTAIKAEELQLWSDSGLIDYLGVSEDVRPFIAAASCVVLPSYYREGVPRALLEGAAMARPIITTDEPGCRELLKHGEGAIACRARDAADLARAMERIINMSQDQRQAMGREARHTVERHFGEEIVIRGYLDALSVAKPHQSKLASERAGMERS